MQMHPAYNKASFDDDGVTFEELLGLFTLRGFEFVSLPEYSAVPWIKL